MDRLAILGCLYAESEIIMTSQFEEYSGIRKYIQICNLRVQRWILVPKPYH